MRVGEQPRNDLLRTASRSNAAALPARVLGAVTVAYSAAIIVAPKLLAGPCRFTDITGSVPSKVAVLIRALGARDVLSGVAMLVARPGTPLAAACLVRSAADDADAVLFGSVLSGSARWKIGGFAACWSLTNLWAAGRATTAS